MTKNINKNKKNLLVENENLLRVGKEISSQKRWDDIATDYATRLKTSYHIKRLEVINKLTPAIKNKNIIDFGCGEGTTVNDLLAKNPNTVYAIDPNKYLLDICKKNNPSSKCLLGGSEKLKEFESNSIDLIIAANVIGYLTSEEEKLFYEESNRIIKKDGNIVLSFSNELFDLFTFNKYTVDFYKRYFAVDISSLINHPNEPNRNAVNIRENPINYPYKVKRFSFLVDEIEYINFHDEPPLISGNNPDDLQIPRKDTLNIDPEEKWKLMFQCSTFAAKLIKV